MPVFHYRAIDDQRNSRVGEVAGESPRDARESLRGQGLIVLEVRPLIADTAAKRPVRLLSKRVSPQLYASMLRDLSTLLGVGIPLTESLDVLIQQYTGAIGTSSRRA